jgi:hypothetical protein
LATAAKIMKGEPCFRKSLMLVAEALGRQYLDLLEGNQQTAESPQEKRYEIHFHLPISKDAVDEEWIIAFIERLRKLIDSDGDIDMTDIKDGSTILTLSMNEHDLDRFLKILGKRPSGKKLLELAIESDRSFGSSTLDTIGVTLISFGEGVKEYYSSISPPAPVRKKKKKPRKDK